MSNLNYPTFFIRFKPFSLKSIFPSTSPLVVCLIWPPRVSYNAWQNFLKSHLWFIGKKNSIHRKKQKKKRTQLERKLAQTKKNEIVNRQSEIIMHKPQSYEPVEDIKLALITMFKQFCE